MVYHNLYVLPLLYVYVCQNVVKAKGTCLSSASCNPGHVKSSWLPAPLGGLSTMKDLVFKEKYTRNTPMVFLMPLFTVIARICRSRLTSQPPFFTSVSSKQLRRARLPFATCPLVYDRAVNRNTPLQPGSGVSREVELPQRKITSSSLGVSILGGLRLLLFTHTLGTAVLRPIRPTGGENDNTRASAL